jgi:hypothetical protein
VFPDNVTHEIFISLADEFTSGCNSLIKKVADHWKKEAFKRI